MSNKQKVSLIWKVRKTRFLSCVMLCLWMLMGCQQVFCFEGKKESEEGEPYSAYLFAYFTGNGEEAIRYAISKDGLNYKALNNNRPVMPLKSSKIHFG